VLRTFIVTMIERSAGLRDAAVRDRVSDGAERSCSFSRSSSWHTWCRRALHRGAGHDADVPPADELSVDQARAERDVPVRRQQRAVHAGLATPAPTAAAGERDLLATADDVVEHILRLDPTRDDSGPAVQHELPGHVDDEAV